MIEHSSASITVKKNEKKQKKSEKFILTASCEQLSGGSAFSEGVTGLFPVNTGVTGVINEVIQGLWVRVTGNTEIQGVT